LVNAWCSGQFTLVDATTAPRRQPNPCASDAGSDVSTTADANSDTTVGDGASADGLFTCTDAGDCTKGPICTIGRCVTGVCVFDSILGCDSGTSGGDGGPGDTGGSGASDAADGADGTIGSTSDGSNAGTDGSSSDGSAIVDGSNPDGSTADGRIDDGAVADGSLGDGARFDTGAGGGSNGDGSTDGATLRDGQAGSRSMAGGSGGNGAAPDSTGGAGGALPSDAFVEGGGCGCAVFGNPTRGAKWTLLALALASTRLRRSRSTKAQPKS
jgi:hypothetical protein